MQSNVAIVLQKADGTIAGWDQGAESLFGYRASETIGQPIEILLADVRHADAPPRWLVAGTGSFVTKRRDTLRLSCTLSPVLDRDLTVIAMCNVFAMEPAVLRTEPAAADSPIGCAAESAPPPPDRAQLERLIETLPGALLSFQRLRDGRCSFPFASAGAAALFGFSPQQLKADGELVISRIPGDDRAYFNQPNAKTDRPDGVWRCEFRYSHPKHGERWLVGTSLPTPARDGVLSWSGVVFDITHRKHTEDSLALAEAQLSSALEAADMGAWVFDAETGKVWGNRHQREMWETPADAPAWYDKATGLSHIHEDDRERTFADLQGALAGKPLRNEFRMVRSDGSIRWIAGRGRADADAQGRRRRVAGVNIDITQQKLMAEKALRSHKLEALGTLAGGIAHDFNNVLFAILGNADVALAESRADRDPSPMLREVRDAAMRAADLVRQILAFSRPSELEARVIDLAAPVRDSLKLVRATTPSMVTIATSFDPATPAVRADSSRVVQVLVNLCTNAVHAIGPRRSGTVDVRLMPVEIGDSTPTRLAQLPKGRYTVLSVTDDGCGMDAATQARIFDPFFTTKAPGEGTGLGLSVVHGIVSAFGAHITLQSEPGKGTTFELYFPAVDLEPQHTDSNQTLPSRGRGQRIMLVDDEPMVVKLGTRLLQNLGYQAVAYSQAQQALEAFRLNPEAYAVVITDLAMPSLSGFELARRMLEIRGDVPIVLMSGNLQPEDRIAALRAGVRETVLKPSSLSTLGDVIARLC